MFTINVKMQDVSKKDVKKKAKSEEGICTEDKGNR